MTMLCARSSAAQFGVARSRSRTRPDIASTPAPERQTAGASTVKLRASPALARGEVVVPGLTERLDAHGPWTGLVATASGKGVVDELLRQRFGPDVVDQIAAQSCQLTPSTEGTESDG
jgi:hypothetical protein